MLDIQDLCRIWNISPITSSWEPSNGTIHKTLLCKTNTGSYALRMYHYSEDKRWRIEREHAIIAYVQAQGMPAIRPLPTSDGVTIYEADGRYYALFPFAPGQQIARLQLSPREAVMMGSFLAQLHHVLYHYPHEAVPQRTFEIDRADAMARMDQVKYIIRSSNKLSEADQQILSRLEQQQKWIEFATPPELIDLSSLDQQVIHGDYQEANLFFENDAVSAIIDWDQTYVATRAWEIVRTLHYAFRLESSLCAAFLQAYRQVHSLPQQDLDLAAAAYGWMRAHDVWLYEAIYKYGNQRLNPPTNPFVPFIERWTALKL